MAPRTVGALATRPTGNAQGNYYFYSLSTGRIINRAHATPLPMPDDVIHRVHTLARQQQADPGLVFLDRDRVPDVNDEDDGDDDEDTWDEEQWVDEPHPVHEDMDQPIIIDHDAPPIDNIADIIEIDDEDPHGEIPGVGYEDHNNVGELDNDQEEEQSDHGSEADVDNAERIVDDNVEQNKLELDMAEQYGQRTHAYNMRPRKPRDYSHLFASKSGPIVATLATPQMNMRRGLITFGEEGVDAVRNEMKQLHDRKVMQVRKSAELTSQQRMEALAYLMFLKRKRSGKVKGRGCSDGRKQRAYTAKEDAASPTVSTESVFLTAVIDALEGRHVAVLDVPGAFMQADMDELVHVRFTGKMVDLLLEIDRDMYQPYVVIERGERVMYVELLKALYGTIRAARLFWEKLSSKLKEWGFTINPYDPCVANKVVDSKQLTVVWHVDDLKVSHVKLTVVDSFVSQMDAEFGADTPINKSRDYLGMIMDYTTPRQVVINMTEYIQTVLQDAPANMSGTSMTPAGHHLFTVSENPELLDGELSRTFVHIVMQLLYLSQRGRPDIRTAISFLCGRLQGPDHDDYKKLTRVVKYLRGTHDLVLTLSSDGSGLIRWWIDASYSVHPDMKGHTGGTMTLGKGSVYSTSNKQKLVTRSSTESEVVGLHDVLPQVLWTRHFMREQGVEIKDSVLYQDNMSAMLLEKNGRASSTKRTKHMNIRYFYVHDRVCAKEVSIEHCPTEDMIADYFTKPLQGQLFRKMRDVIMNIGPDSKYHSGHRSVLRGDAYEEL
jgi:hypothetical protein